MASPSDRQPVGGGADDQDDILERPPSHPFELTLMILTAIALLLAIGIQANELGWYRNERTKADLDNYTKTAVDWVNGLDLEQAPGAPSAPRRAPASAPSEEAPAEEAPAEQPSEEKPAEEKPAEEQPPAEEKPAEGGEGGGGE